ncbi:MAG: hypothetical protein HY902_02345 [Deltaproteobacteria bacterium]|nr:hypothetical protein [Deltaproteobacteria bacterium]
MQPISMTPDGLRQVARIVPRGDELGCDAAVPPVHQLAWFEHGRWEATALSGTGMDEVFGHDRIAVVRSQRAAFLRPVGIGEPVALSVGLGRVGKTSFEIVQSLWTEPAGTQQPPECIAVLSIAAVALGADRRPSPVPDAVRALARDMPPVPALAGLDLVPVERPDFTWEIEVRPSEIDVFSHVNHACYARWADDARQLRDRARGLASQPLQRIAVDYQRETVLGERVEVRLQELGPGDVAAEVRVGDEVRARARLQAPAAN